VSKLFVFEGPDNVGKTTLSIAVERVLSEAGVSCVRLSFPGDEPESLGRFVHEIHHRVISGTQSVRVTPTALQLLHVAAHVDVIERRILPLLTRGTVVLLDRFWWSTYVYGKAAGVPSTQLRAMLDAEAASWRGVEPELVFLVERQAPDVDERLADGYASLAATEKRYPVLRLDNSRDIEAVIKDAVEIIGRSTLAGTVRRSIAPSADPTRGGSVGKMPLFLSTLSPAKVSAVYDTYWKFARERQEIFFRRLDGHREDLTNDPILRQHKFTNAYRASDRVSQFLIRHVIYAGEQSAEEIFFRTLVFKLFNKIDTWRLLQSALGEVSWRSYDFRRYDKVLSDALAAGERIYSAAYIMPTARGFGDETRKHRTHLQLLESMIHDGAPARLGAARNMRQAFDMMKRYPMMGDFLAFQFVIDLNYSTLTDFSEMEFVVPGPGARDGIRKCFTDMGGLSESDLIRLVADRQDYEFERLGLSFRSLWGRSLQLIDCQNLFCETDKYARLAHPDVVGISGRTKIKQIYKPTAEDFEYWYPPKWKLGEAIVAHYASRLASQD
jgi:thymidylate kinase